MEWFDLNVNSYIFLLNENYYTSIKLCSVHVVVVQTFSLNNQYNDYLLVLKKNGENFLLYKDSL